MSNIRELPKPDPQVKETLQEVLDHVDDIEGVIVLVLNKDGKQELVTSSMNMPDKCFLKAFFDAWTAKWFFDMYDV